MRSHVPWAAALLLSVCPSTGRAQHAVPAPVATERPRPYPVFETPAFARAVEHGTRTRTGRPGSSYWTNRATYRIEAELDPAARRLTGREWVRYTNHSPDTILDIYLHLEQNLFAPNAPRRAIVPVTGGVELSRVAIGGRELAPLREGDGGEGYQVSATILRLHPAAPLLPSGSVDLEFAWAFTVPPDGAPRGGQDGEVFFVSYWYPALAVFDDLSPGWQTDPYMGGAEFYFGYGDYDVALTVPEGWLVGATGTLENAADVLSPAVRSRLAGARRGGAVVHVVGDADRGAGTATARGANGKLIWRFRAQDVRDFAFGASDRYLWDATVADVGDANGDGRSDTAAIHTFYRPSRRAWAWDQSAPYLRQSVEWLSRWLWPYPYPTMTAMDGPTSCSGMEYPMMTCVGGPRDTLSLYSVIVHETAHMWFPMQVGSDERRHAWMDEGLTRFNQSQAMFEYFPGVDRWAESRAAYDSAQRAGLEVEVMRHGDLYPVGSRAYAVASYEKTSLILRALRAMLGDSTFLRAYREYGRRWRYRHPTPYDFWNTFNDVGGRNLDWFWRTWFYETWPLDQAIASVTPRGRDLAVVIEDRGLASLPVRLAITRRDGAVERFEVPVDVWLAGSRRHVVRIRGGASVLRVEIDPESAFPDVDRTNQWWVRP